MNGFLIANKPTGVTSSDVVVFVRRRLPRGTAIGHGGTLDPEASGVLPLCIGKATRLFDYIIDKKKTYVAEIRLGEITDTQDATGKIVETREVTTGADELNAVLDQFVGTIEQIPPMYSAIKRDGKRLYQLARKGETIEVEPRKCRVDAIRLLGKSAEHTYKIEVECGKGVYIRTLCHDIGERLGCGAHMASLKRTSAGVFTLENTFTREQIAEMCENGTLESALIPMDAPLNHLKAVCVGENARHAVRNGNPLKPQWMNEKPAAGEIVRVYLSGKFAGIACGEADGSARFKAMLLEEDR